MPTVFIKREDGAAFISVTEEIPGNPTPKEGGRPLEPDELVDGKKVSDWPAGVFTVKTVTKAS
jgi:hypothetical protein